MKSKSEKSIKNEGIKPLTPADVYIRHFCLNIGVFFKCIIMAIFHLSHAILPIKITSHNWWGIWKEG